MECIYSNINRVREVSFTRGGTSVTPKEVFDILYSPMDELVSRNVEAYLTLGRHKFDTYEQSHTFKSAAQTTEEAVAKTSGLVTCLIKTDDGQALVLPVKPRTNYDRLSIKRPNIALLGPTERGSPMVLREARTYEGHGLMFKEAAVKYNQHFDYDDYDTLGAGKNVEVVGKKSIILIPESPLVLALEQLALNGITPRLTPQIKVVGSEGRDMWTIRQFLPALRDLNFDLPGLISNIVHFHALGILDCLDGKSEHYCSENGKVVNIDPDFQCYTPNRMMIDHYGLQDFRERILPDFLRGNKDIDLGPQRRRVIEDVMQKLNGQTILNYLPLRVSESPILQTLKTENAVIK